MVSTALFLAAVFWGGSIKAGNASKFGKKVQLCGRAGTAQSGGSGREEDDGHDEHRP